MADSPVFEHTCSTLEEHTDLDRLAARGTVRIAVKEAGLDVASVDREQMTAVLRKMLPQQLESRGIADAQGICEAIASGLAGMSFAAVHDRAGAAARTMARLGS